MEEHNVLNVLKHLDDWYIGEVNVTQHLKAKYFQIQFLRARLSESGEVRSVSGTIVTCLNGKRDTFNCHRRKS